MIWIVTYSDGANITSAWIRSPLAELARLHVETKLGAVKIYSVLPKD